MENIHTDSHVETEEDFQRANKRPEKKWADISQRISDIEETAKTISHDMLMLSETDDRHLNWVKVARNIQTVREEFSQKWDSEETPDPEILEMLSRAEREIKKFVS